MLLYLEQADDATLAEAELVHLDTLVLYRARTDSPTLAETVKVVGPGGRLVYMDVVLDEPGGAPALRERIAEADDTSARLLSVVEQLSAEQPQYASILSSMVQAVLSANA